MSAAISNCCSLDFQFAYVFISTEQCQKAYPDFLICLWNIMNELFVILIDKVSGLIFSEKAEINIFFSLYQKTEMLA